MLCFITADRSDSPAKCHPGEQVDGLCLRTSQGCPFIAADSETFLSRVVGWPPGRCGIELALVGLQRFVGVLLWWFPVGQHGMWAYRPRRPVKSAGPLHSPCGLPCGSH